MSVLRLIVETRSSNIFISGKIIKEIPGSVASGTPCIVALCFEGPGECVSLLCEKKRQYYNSKSRWFTNLPPCSIGWPHTGLQANSFAVLGTGWKLQSALRLGAQIAYHKTVL